MQKDLLFPFLRARGSTLPVMGKSKCRFFTKSIVLMKLVLILEAGASGHAQSITLSMRKVSLEKVFSEIEKQTRYFFIYTNEELEHANPVTINMKNGTLKAALDICMEGQTLEYSVREPYIIIKKKSEKLATPVQSINLVITGRIRNEKGEPIAGATVAIKGTKLATATDEKGAFILSYEGEQPVLLVSCIGYTGREIAVTAQKDIDIVLFTRISTLDETVVMAYGNTTRRLNTGNITKFASKEIEKQPVSNPLEALQGRVPGLIITQTSGIPGAALKVEIRGRSALDLSYSRNDPLFIIDGVPFEPGNISTNQVNNATIRIGDGSQGGISPLNTINPSDIESIEVLKDADATAIYGSRGANGVILITTHKGHPGKTRITASFTRGTSRPQRLMPMLNTAQYIEMRREAFENDGVTPTITNAPDLLLWDLNRYTDFTKLFTGNTAKTNHAQVSVSGGSVNTQFRFGMGYLRQTNVFSSDLSDNIISAHFSTTHISDNKNLSITVTGSFANDRNRLLRDNLVRYRNLPPHTQLLDSAGNLKWNAGGVEYVTVFNNQVGNPLALQKRTYTSVNENWIYNMNLAYKIMKGFSIRLNAGYNSFSTDETGITPRSSIPPSFAGTGSSVFADNHSKSWIIEPQLEYSNLILKGRLSLLAGSTLQESSSKGRYIDASNFTSDLLLGSVDAAGTVSSSGSYQQYRYNALFGRINYNWKDKYIVNATARRDGSSRFGPGKRFANFGALGIVWIFTNEKFAKNFYPVISFGKIRGSLGVTGNDQIGNYRYLDLWNSTSNPYQGIPGLVPGSLFNPDYNWERNRKYELALELGFMKDRLLFTAAFYSSRSGNQLVSYRLPGQVGFQSIIKNLPARVDNHGVEITLASENIRSKTFSWKTSFHITFPENKLVSFPGLATSTYANTYIEGSSLSVFRGYRFLGVNDTTGAYYFEDLTKDGVISSSDKQFLGDRDPEWYGGLQNSFTFKSIALSFFFEFRKQTGENYLGRLSLGESPGRLANQPVIVVNRWRKPGDISPIQRFSQNANTGLAAIGVSNFLSSDGAYSDASFMRLKNISIDYSISELLAKKLHVRDINLFIQGQNLFVITNYKGSDPETQDFYALPPLKTFVFGIKITL
jgi:TonB-dependent starch-binding outer membrane protein SusC